MIQKAPAVGVIHVKDVFVPGQSAAGDIATCPRRQRATGGGAYLEGTRSTDAHIVDSEPAVPDKTNQFRPVLGGIATSWHVGYYKSDSEQRLLHIWVLCTG